MATQLEIARASGARIYRLHATSGLITGVSADGVIAAWRNPSADVPQHLLAIVCRARTVSGFTAAQQLALSAHWVTAFGSPAANYTGGTDLSDPATPAYNLLNQPLTASLDPYTAERTKSVLASGNVRIATTSALSHAGSPTIRTQPFARDSFSELATGASIHKGFCDAFFPVRDDDPPQMLGQNAGFIVKLPVALGAGGTVEFDLDVLWYERP